MSIRSVLPVVLLCSSVSLAGWEPHISKDGGFRCEFPGTFQTRTSELPDGTNLHVASHSRDKGNIAYTVSWSSADDADFDAVLEGIAARLGLKTTPEGMEVRIEGNAGRDYAVTAKVGRYDLFMSGRLVNANGRLYHLSIVQLGGNDLPASETTRFLRSFKLGTEENE